MMKQYSFLYDSTYLEEGKLKSTIGGLLALAGTAGSFGVKLPQSYIQANPGSARTFGGRVIQVALQPPSKKVNWGQEFTRGLKMGRDEMFKRNARLRNTEKLGNSIKRTFSNPKNSLTNNILDAAKGNVSL